jgi:hypothetical protein
MCSDWGHNTRSSWKRVIDLGFLGPATGNLPSLDDTYSAAKTRSAAQDFAYFSRNGVDAWRYVLYK